MPMAIRGAEIGREPIAPYVSGLYAIGPGVSSRLPSFATFFLLAAKTEEPAVESPGRRWPKPLLFVSYFPGPRPGGVWPSKRASGREAVLVAPNDMLQAHQVVTMQSKRIVEM